MYFPGVLISSLKTMSSFKTVLVVPIAIISIGELVKIAFVNGVGVDGDISGVEGGEGVGGATSRIIFEGLNGIKSVPVNALSIFGISIENEPSKGPARVVRRIRGSLDSLVARMSITPLARFNMRLRSVGVL
jgi:hypothetical protein